MTATWLEGRLGPVARELGVVLRAGVCEQLARYASLILDWGARINLTGARTGEALADEHLADALALLPLLPRGAFRFVDVGSGAGLPGMVIGLLRSDASGVLLEPTGKKHAFLAHAIRSLELGDRIESRRERLEAHLASYRGQYDLAVSRAVWPVAEWLEKGRALVEPGGLLLGVEGASPGALPLGAERHSYVVAGRRRTLVSLRA